MLVPATRASDAERERALATLRDAAVEGRLTFEELGQRAERVERALTQRELARVVADLPRPKAPAPAGRPRERAVLSRVKRAGRWQPAVRTRYTAVLGSVDVDLRKATLPGEVVEIELRPILGTTRLRLPPGVELQIDEGGVLCSRDVRVEGDAPPGAPVVRVRTRGVLGQVQVRCQPRLVDQLATTARRWVESRLA